jgi:myo-inositol catabolism protein IolC
MSDVVVPHTSRLPSPAQPLFILAMDHRDSFGRNLFGVQGAPDDQQLAAMRDAKSVIFEAVSRATDRDLHGAHRGVLVDEQLGADIARKVKGAGFQLAMPVEVSGSDRLEFQYGDKFGEHIEAFDPDWVKVLVRYNPADASELKTSQTETLRRLQDWVLGARRHWMLELLVPPTRKQLAQHEDQLGFDTALRPSLTSTSIRELTDAGIRPSIWKLEGYETQEGATEVLDTVKAVGGGATTCIVLGRNAPISQVDHWLEVAAPLQGFSGFAIGRTIWEEPLEDYVAGRVKREETEQKILSRYEQFIQHYLQWDAAPEADPDHPRAEPFTYGHPRLTPDREARIRLSTSGIDPRSRLPAWMVMSLLAEVDALREES